MEWEKLDQSSLEFLLQCQSGYCCPRAMEGPWNH